MVALDTAFWHAVLRSLEIAGCTAIASLAIGWPLGVRLAFASFTTRRVLVTLLALPLLLPSFLIAIGLSMLSHRISGFAGTLWAFSCLGVPLVACGSLAAALSITRSQTDAARLAGGEKHLFRLAGRATFPFAALAASLAAVATLTDPGPGQILGWPGAAGELLITFAARYDLRTATIQAIAIGGITALLVWPVAWALAPTTAEALLSRDSQPPEPRKSRFTVVALITAVVVFTLLPLSGLTLPLTVHEWPMRRAWSEVARTARDTLLYAFLAASLAVMVAFSAAWLIGRHAAGRRLLVAFAFGLLAVPPALPALWLVPWSNTITVSGALAARGLPVAILFAIRAVGSMPRSWSEAARVHRVPCGVFIGRVALPWLARWAFPAAGVAALLATAEVGTVLLLHPPGRGTLPLAIFTIMANAPEALVSMLCLLYVLLAAIIGVVLHRSLRPS